MPASGLFVKETIPTCLDTLGELVFLFAAESISDSYTDDRFLPKHGIGWLSVVVKSQGFWVLILALPLASCIARTSRLASLGLTAPL